MEASIAAASFDLFDLFDSVSGTPPSPGPGGLSPFDRYRQLTTLPIPCGPPLILTTAFGVRSEWSLSLLINGHQ